MKISLVWCSKDIAKECECFKYYFKIWLHYVLRVRLNSSLAIIVLFHILEIAAADDNDIKYKHPNEESISYSDEHENSLEKQLMGIPTLENNSKEKTSASVKRYKIVDIEFQRVETPILIAMWIFCASLAKICKPLFFFFCLLK